jgi:hypothetical protein
MSPETLPPYRHISSQSISLADASKMLDRYLTNSERYPHLHPDALITPAGVTFSSHGGPAGGVVMHNLRRVAAGLRGEHLEPQATPEPEEQEHDSGTSDWKGKGKKANKRTHITDGTQNEWQSMSEYEREEGNIEVGDIGDRMNVVQEGDNAPEAEMMGGAEQGGREKKPGSEGAGPGDKKARKQAKKARHKEERTKKEKAREGKSKK